MTAGRPKKPLERKALLAKGDGQISGHKLAQTVGRPPRMVGQPAPPPPADITGRGLREWHKVWEAGYWLHEDQDYHWVEMIARAYDDIETFRDQINHDGLICKGYAGQMVAHPLIKEIRDAERAVMKCLSTIGFSPSDRARLNLTEAQAQGALMDLMQKTRANR